MNTLNSLMIFASFVLSGLSPSHCWCQFLGRKRNRSTITMSIDCQTRF